jgi:hypothetical protein
MCEFGHCLVRPRDRDFDLTFTTNDRSIFGRLIVFPIKFRIRAVFWPHRFSILKEQEKSERNLPLTA